MSSLGSRLSKGTYGQAGTYSENMCQQDKESLHIKSYEEWLKKGGLLGLPQKKNKVRDIQICKCCHMQEDVEVLFVEAGGRTKNDALKLKKKRFRLNIKKEFVLRAVQQWNSLFQIVQCLLQVCK